MEKSIAIFVAVFMIDSYMFVCIYIFQSVLFGVKIDGYWPDLLYFILFYLFKEWNYRVVSSRNIERRNITRVLFQPIWFDAIHTIQIILTYVREEVFHCLLFYRKWNPNRSYSRRVAAQCMLHWDRYAYCLLSSE